MAIYAISQEGAESMHQLSINILSSISDIQNATRELSSHISGNMDELGVYGEEIWSLTTQIDEIILENQNNLIVLAEKVKKKSDEILELIGSSFSGGGEKLLASDVQRPKVLNRNPDEAIDIGIRAIDAQMDALRDDCKDKGITNPSVVEAIIHQKREAAEIDFYNDLFGDVDEKTIAAYNRLSVFFSESTWKSLNNEERENALNTLAVDVGVAYRTEIKGIVFFDGPPQSRGYYNGDGFLYLNSDCLSDPNNRIDALDTIFHEGRHAFQRAAINDPHKHGITAAQAAIWEDNFRHYLTSERFGYERYYSQPVEADAFSFSEHIIRIGGIK